jgi:hypothetical protein
MIPASEPAKTVHALDRWATVTGHIQYTKPNFHYFPHPILGRDVVEENL